MSSFVRYRYHGISDSAHFEWCLLILWTSKIIPFFVIDLFLLQVLAQASDLRSLVGLGGLGAVLAGLAAGTNIFGLPQIPNNPNNVLGPLTG
jgi:hypothetical protein